MKREEYIKEIKERLIDAGIINYIAESKANAALGLFVSETNYQDPKIYVANILNRMDYKYFEPESRKEIVRNYNVIWDVDVSIAKEEDPYYEAEEIDELISLIQENIENRTKNAS